MGWTGTHKYKDESMQNFVEREIKYNSNFERIGKGFYKNGAFYGAVKNKKTGAIIAEVILFQFSKNNEHENIWYKEQDETVGPYKYDCPDRILDLLTDPLNEWAASWRKKCREQNAKSKIKLTPGTKVKFKTDFTFSGNRIVNTFLYTELKNYKGNKIKRLYAIGENGGFYTTAGLLKKYEYEILTA